TNLILTLRNCGLNKRWHFILWLWLICFSVSAQIAPEIWLPDPALRAAVREALELAPNEPLTQDAMKRLTKLVAPNSDIADITGLQHATNLDFLVLGGNPISDLQPLHVCVLLTLLNLEGCSKIKDIRPLKNLVRLESLSLGYNKIEDIRVLRNLEMLTRLSLRANHIRDFSPLLELRYLTYLNISRNPALNYSLLHALEIETFIYDEFCHFLRPAITDRMENRSFPSVFQAVDGPMLNEPELSTEFWVPISQFEAEFEAHHGEEYREEYRAYYDLVITGDAHHVFKFAELDTSTPERPEVRVLGDLDRAQQIRDQFMALNPNMLFIVATPLVYIGKDDKSDDWPYWMRDAEGNRVYELGWNAAMIDFTHPGAQDWIVEKAIALAKCGLFDGILLDWYKEDGTILSTPTGQQLRSTQAQIDALLSILQRIREYAGDDFLIFVNPNREKIPISAPYVNGLFMETLRDGANRRDGYSREGLLGVEDTLRWAEENLREPQVNCLEGWGNPNQPPDSPTNRRFMRIFTVMSLVFSNGYVVWNNGLDHSNYWYDFYDADLGHPVGEKGQVYENIKGLFIREFTNGWAVYNRSGEEQIVKFPVKSSGVESGITAIEHTIPDLDGEIFLKVPVVVVDLNNDGVVNILDLVIVAGEFGVENPTHADVNGDGVVNILDLVSVAQAIGRQTDLEKK
ncbi:MAG: putative glycoside hydrolase, partial [Candidatus Poribacteria bacterium]|nr:putative glycoside hydrolase [Candidatus Poribacteria bacterium]